MKERDYQLTAIRKTFEFFKRKDAGYLKMATGSGKTFTTQQIIKYIIEYGRDSSSILFVVPKNILLKQAEKQFKNIGCSVGVYNAELGRKETDKRIVIASIQSIVNCKDDLNFFLVVYDEVHRAKGSHTKLWNKIKAINPSAKLLGLTATDYDIDENLFTEKIYDIGLKTLTDQGYLARLFVGGGRSKIDTSLLKIQNGDYSTKSIEEQLSTKKMTEQCTDMIARTQDRKRVIILCASINHAESITSMLNGALVYHSKLKKDIRSANLECWKNNGKYLVSVLAASEGFDYPPTDCIVFMRPTRSATLYEQAIGRAARLSEDKYNGLILDYGGVVSSLGLPYNIRPIPKNEIASKECEECLTENEVSAKFCEYCKNPFMTKCKICEEKKIVGDKCCEQEPRDILKNLTLKAWTKKDNWHEVGNISLTRCVSKSGNDCLKATFWGAGMFGTKIADMYFLINKPMFGDMKIHYQTFCMNIYKQGKIIPPDELLDKKPVSLPSKVLVIPNGKHRNITSMDFT